MGATAFAIFGDYDRSVEKWHLGKELYMVALRAVSNERNKRQQSIQQFIEEWNEAQSLTEIESSINTKWYDIAK